MRTAEIFEQAQTLTAAFFGVKLGREDIVAGFDRVRMDKIKPRPVFHSAEKRMRLRLPSLAPAEARESSRIRQFTETPRKKSTTMPLKISDFSSGAAWAAPGITARFRVPDAAPQFVRPLKRIRAVTRAAKRQSGRGNVLQAVHPAPFFHRLQTGKMRGKIGPSGNFKHLRKMRGFRAVRQPSRRNARRRRFRAVPFGARARFGDGFKPSRHHAARARAA